MSPGSLLGTVVCRSGARVDNGRRGHRGRRENSGHHDHCDCCEGMSRSLMEAGEAGMKEEAGGSCRQRQRRHNREVQAVGGNATRLRACRRPGEEDSIATLSLWLTSVFS